MVTGQFKTFIDGTLTLGHPPDADSHHVIPATAKVTLNAKTVKMSDLRPNDGLTLTDDPITSVTALRS